MSTLSPSSLSLSYSYNESRHSSLLPSSSPDPGEFNFYETLSHHTNAPFSGRSQTVPPPPLPPKPKMPKNGAKKTREEQRYADGDSPKQATSAV